MILTVFLAAPTVPSEPRPKKTAVSASVEVRKSAGTGSERCVTSSLMPTVKRLLGWSAASSANTAAAIAGVYSLLDRP